MNEKRLVSTQKVLRLLTINYNSNNNSYFFYFRHHFTTQCEQRVILQEQFGF